MSETKYKVKTTSRFKRDFKLAKRRGLDTGLLEETISVLANGGTLPERYHDHALIGKLDGFRECHVLPDFLLIYLIEDDVLTLTLIESSFGVPHALSSRARREIPSQSVR